MTLPEAILTMRQAANKSQQVFATELGIATKSLQMYESGNRLPEPRTLLALAAYADALDLDDYFTLFLGDAFMEQLHPPKGWEVEIRFRRTPRPKGKSR